MFQFFVLLPFCFESSRNLQVADSTAQVMSWPILPQIIDMNDSTRDRSLSVAGPW